MRRRSLILKAVIIFAAIYVSISALAFVAQERMLFPSHMVFPAGPLPPGSERLEVHTPDGMRLEGIRIPPQDGARSPTLVMVFVGNASNAQGVAELIHEIYPQRDVVAFHYRGYPPSSGVAGAQALMDDAPLIYDAVVQRLRPQKVIAVGISLGSGVASALAARRPLAGAILVTPFDSLSAVARQLYPWLPVSLLLRHDMRSADLLRGSRVPVAIIAAGRDRLIRRERTDALRRAVPNLVFDTTIADARHNDIGVFPAFDAAMLQAIERIEAAQ